MILTLLIIPNNLARGIKFITLLSFVIVLWLVLVKSEQIQKSCLVITDKLHGKYYQYKPGHSISYKIACAPSEHSDHPRRLIRVIAVRLKTLWILGYPRSALPAKTLLRLRGFAKRKKNEYPCKLWFYYIKVGFKGVKII